MRGHKGNSETVMPNASITRAGLFPPPMPGMGTKTKTPATRASVKRKPNSVAVERIRSPPIAAQVPQYADGVGAHLVEHPGQREDEGAQKSEQARDGVESRVLDGGDDLDQADQNAHHEAHGEQRQRQPEGRHEGLPENLSDEFGGHV